MVKECRKQLFGLIDPHDFAYKHDRQFRVCLKCGIYEKFQDVMGADFIEDFWSSEGVIDNPLLLAVKWEKEGAIENSRDTKMKWMDVK